MSIVNNSPIVKVTNDKWVVNAENGAKIVNCEILGEIWIGSYSYVNNSLIRSHVEIGRFCSIGRNTSLGLGVHNYHNFSTHPIFDKGKEPISFVSQNRRLIIENDCWIGDKVMIVSGITLGTGCVVAAGSVVTKDVPPYAIVGGVPAKIIKYRFPDSVIKKLLTTQWWLYDIELLKQAPNDVEGFLNFLEKDELMEFRVPLTYIKIRPQS